MNQTKLIDELILSWTFYKGDSEDNRERRIKARAALERFINRRINESYLKGVKDALTEVI